MKELLNQFKDYLTINKRCNSYYYKIKLFIKFVEREKLDLYKITTQDLDKYLLFLTEKYSDGYINNLKKAIKSFYGFLIHNDLVDESVLKVTDKLKMNSVVTKKKKRLTEKDLEELVKRGIMFCKQIDSLKLKTVLNFLFYTGIRKQQFLNLKREHIDIDQGTVKVGFPTKNGSEYITAFPESIGELLKKYFKYEKEETNAFNITESKLMYIFSTLKEFTPEGKTFSPHAMRHGFGNMLANSSIDSRVAQKLLGHKSINSTLIYYDPDEQMAIDIYRKKKK